MPIDFSHLTPYDATGFAGTPRKGFSFGVSRTCAVHECHEGKCPRCQAYCPACLARTDADTETDMALLHLEDRFYQHQSVLHSETREISHEAFWHFEDISYGLSHKLDDLEERVLTARRRNLAELRALVDAFA